MPCVEESGFPGRTASLVFPGPPPTPSITGTGKSLDIFESSFPHL